MFSRNEKSILSDNYFLIVREEEKFIEIMSKNTGHCWIIYKKSGVADKPIDLYHKHTKTTQYYHKHVIDKVKAELEKRATGLGRVFDPRKKSKREVQKAFYFGNEETRFQDPYKQAEYLYGLIEGVQMNG